MNGRDPRAAYGDRFWARVRELEHSPRGRTRRQHVVSKVLLKRFAVDGPKRQGLQLLPFDLHYPDRRHKLKGPAGCGWAEHLVPYESTSLEKLWARTEAQLPDLFAALDSGRLHDDPHLHSLAKDLIALHWVRSYHYIKSFHRIYGEFERSSRHYFMTDGQALTRAAFIQEHGFHFAGPQGLAHAVDSLMRPQRELYESGALLRIRMEDMYDKVRTWLTNYALQIGRPGKGEFLIGDTPAQTVHRDDTGHIEYGMALGDASSVILPLGPKHLAAIGKTPLTTTLPQPFVDQMNRLQIVAAHQHVFLRPGSQLEPFIRASIALRTTATS